METITINEQAEQLAQETTAIACKFQDYAIKTAEQFTGAAEALKIIKSKAAQLEDLRKSMTRPLDESKKLIMDFFRGPTDMLGKVEAMLKLKMGTYNAEQERIRAEHERKLQAAARAEEEKQRQALMKKAEKAAAKGNEEKAAELQEQAATVFIPAPIVEKAMPKVEGVSFKVNWEFEIVDAAAIPREYLVPDATKIGGVVRAMKEACVIPGVRVFKRDVVSSTRRGQS